MLKNINLFVTIYGTQRPLSSPKRMTLATQRIFRFDFSYKTSPRLRMEARL